MTGSLSPAFGEGVSQQRPRWQQILRLVLSLNQSSSLTGGYDDALIAVECRVMATTCMPSSYAILRLYRNAQGLARGGQQSDKVPKVESEVD